jgi:quercetin dioxygenase-like cupin family protein
MLVRAIAALCLAVPGAALAADHHGAAGMVVLPDAAAAAYQPGPPDLPKGTQVSAVSGDPAKPGAFVLRVKVPANTVIAPHTHTKPETLTILSGSIYHAHGETLDRSAGQILKTGGFVYLPEAMPHSLWTADEPVELQVNGTGPFGLQYVNPSDDPSRAAGR